MKKIIHLSICGVTAAVLLSGCIVAGPPMVGVSATYTVAPDYYVWDGVEYVGVIGSQYYYLGPGDVWVVCDPVRVERFRVWVNVHPDWQAHATVNVHYRGNAKPHGESGNSFFGGGGNGRGRGH